nr:enoyl-CoA hydratase [Oxalobacteraceae bacterium]
MLSQSLSFGLGSLDCQIDWRGVAYLYLNRPEVHNAYNDHMLDGLHQAMDLIERDLSIRALVLSAKGQSFQ